MPLSVLMITDASGTRTELSWGGVSTITRYELIRVQPTGDLRILSSGAGLKHVDRDGLRPGQAEVYYVRALDASNAERWRTTSPTLTPLAHALADPTGLVVDPADLDTEGHVKPFARLHWNAVSGAVGYHLQILDAGGRTIRQDLVSGTNWPGTLEGSHPATWPTFLSDPASVSVVLPASASLQAILTALRTEPAGTPLAAVSVVDALSLIHI